jgi:hypothetical protein
MNGATSTIGVSLPVSVLDKQDEACRTTNGKRWPLGRKTPEGAKLYSLNQIYGNITIQLEIGAFEWPGQMGFGPPEVKQALFRMNETKIQDLGSSRGLRTRMINRLMICAGYPSTSKMKGYATCGGGAIMTMTFSV